MKNINPNRKMDEIFAELIFKIPSEKQKYKEKYQKIKQIIDKFGFRQSYIKVNDVALKTCKILVISSRVKKKETFSDVIIAQQIGAHFMTLTDKGFKEFSSEYRFNISRMENIHVNTLSIWWEYQEIFNIIQDIYEVNKDLEVIIIQKSFIVDRQIQLSTNEYPEKWNEFLKSLNKFWNYVQNNFYPYSNGPILFGIHPTRSLREINNFTNSYMTNQESSKHENEIKDSKSLIERFGYVNFLNLILSEETYTKPNQLITNRIDKRWEPKVIEKETFNFIILKFFKKRLFTIEFLNPKVINNNQEIKVKLNQIYTILSIKKNPKINFPLILWISNEKTDFPRKILNFYEKKTRFDDFYG